MLSVKGQLRLYDTFRDMLRDIQCILTMHASVASTLGSHDHGHETSPSPYFLPTFQLCRSPYPLITNRYRYYRRPVNMARQLPKKSSFILFLASHPCNVCNTTGGGIPLYNFTGRTNLLEHLKLSVLVQPGCLWTSDSARAAQGP